MSRSSYGFLVPDAKELANGFLALKIIWKAPNYSAKGAAGYNALDESQRATFEAITDALQSRGLLDRVAQVREIWGQSDSKDGKDQYRLSVRFKPGTVAYLKQLVKKNEGFEKGCFAHVKLPSGDVITNGAACVRESGHPPNLQISWLKRDRIIGEVDIDYRELGEGHGDPANSDVRASVEEDKSEYRIVQHYGRHVIKYGVPALQCWWERRASEES